MYIEGLLPQVVIVIATVIVIPLLIQGIKLIREKYKPGEKFERWLIIGISFVLSVGAGVLWFPPELPVFTEDPVQFVWTLLLASTPWFTSVQLIYNWFLDKVFIGLGWNVPDEPKILPMPEAE